MLFCKERIGRGYGRFVGPFQLTGFSHIVKGFLSFHESHSLAMGRPQLVIYAYDYQSSSHRKTRRCEASTTEEIWSKGNPPKIDEQDKEHRRV